MIFQRVVALDQGSSLFSQIIANALPSLVDLWKMIALFLKFFFVIIDCHFVIMSPLWMGSLLNFC
jgi:hypothetical protein